MSTATFDGPSTMAPPGARDLARESSARILVVDDIEANLIATRAVLGDMGLEVLTAASGPAALELLLRHDVALALLDVQMPGMDGYSLAELMRGSERTRNVPIIFLTAGAQEAKNTFRGYEAGAVDFLYKPLDDHMLRSKVAVFAELHRQRRALAEHAAELARLSRANSVMLNALSHDLRGPLTALALNAELLERRAETPAQQAAAARQKSATALLHRQVDHLLSLSKLPHGKQAVHTQPVDLAELAGQRWALCVDEAVPEVRGRFHAEGDTRGQWDSTLLASAIDQLLLQAETYCQGSSISMEVDGSALGTVRLRVSFPSVLSEDAALHLIGSSGPDAGTSVTGSGLTFAERLARAHGGTLVASTHAKQGTAFELLLPREPQ